MNEFWVEFKDGTTAGQITAGLDAVPASGRSYDDGTWYFEANWKTDAKSLGNLSGRIQAASGHGSVKGIGVQDE